MMWKFLVFFTLLRGLSANISDLATFPPNDENASSVGRRWLQSKFRELNGSLGEQEDAVSMTGGSESFRNFTGDSSDSKSAWFADVPVLPLVFATSATLPEGACRDQVRRYLRELRRGKLWAVEMLDASTKYPDGIICGNTKHLGNFDQCYNLHANLASETEGSKKEEVYGRYCLVSLEYHPMYAESTSRPHSLPFDPNESAWEAVREKGNFVRVRRYELQMAICVPATCTEADVEVALKEPLQQYAANKGVQLKTSVKREHCQARIDAPKFSSEATIYCCVVLGLVVLIAVSTWYDSSLCEIDGEEHVSLKDLLLCFSVRRNLQFNSSLQSSHPGLGTIHFIRSVFMAGVIIGHRIMQYCGFPVIETVETEKAFKLLTFRMMVNGPVIVDGFLGLGGLLTAYQLCMELEVTKRIHFTAHILIRFLRLTPVYMSVVFFNAYVLTHLGSGPYWEQKIGYERDNCAANWWTNLLYINNYVNNDKMCMFQSWYLSVDYHMYIITLFVIYAFWQLPRRFGYAFLGLLIATSSMIPFIITYVNDVSPLFMGMLSSREVREVTYFVHYYIKTHMRAAPYLVGVLAGVIVYDHRRATWKLPKAWSRILFFFLAVGLNIASQGLAYKYFDPDYERYPLDSSLYAALHRPAYALSICAIIVLVTVGDGLDFHRNFLTPWWAPPLSRLTYGAFLVHNINQSYEIGVTRAPRAFTLHNVFWDFVPDIVCTFAVSLALSIAVERPIRLLEKLYLTKRYKDVKISEVNSIRKTN